MYIEAALRLVLWLVADDDDAVHSILRTAIFNALVLHFATLMILLQNRFSFYHTTVAVQFIFLSILPFWCALGSRPWSSLRRPLGLAHCLNCLFFAGETIYLIQAKRAAQELEDYCVKAICEPHVQSMSEFYELQNKHLLFLLAILWLLPTTALLRVNEFLPLFERYGKISIAIWTSVLCILSFSIENNAVQHYRHYIGGTETEWGWGQLVAFGTLIHSLYEFIHYASDKHSEGDERRYVIWLHTGNSPSLEY